MSITRLRDEDREFMLTQILGQREAPPTATEVLRKARIEHGSSMHFQSRRDRIFQAQPSSARVQFGTEEDQTVAINGDGVAPDEPTQLALDVPKHFSIKHASHKFGSVLAGNAIFTSTIDGDTDDRLSTDDTPTAPSNRWHVAPFPIRIALEKDPHEPAGSGSESVTAASLGGGARSRSHARSMSQLSVERLAEPNRQHGVSGGGGGDDGGAGLEREEGEEQELQGPHSELVDRADEALNTARSKRYRRGSLDAADSSFKRSEPVRSDPVYAMTATTKFMANLPAGASESGGAVVGRKHVDANSRDAWAAAAAAAGVQVSGASFSGASASGGINGVRAPPVRRASQVSYGDYSGAAAAAAAAAATAAAAAATAFSAGGIRHGASETLATTASINSSAGARFMMPAPPPPRAASHNLGAVSSTSRRSSVVGEPASGELSGGGTATFSSCGESGALSSASPPRMLSRGPSALSMGIPDPCASGSASGHLHGHSWKQQQQQQQRSEATYGGAGLIGGISTEKEAANTLGLLAKVAHTELRPAAPQLWTVEPYQASGIAALSAAAASTTGGALAPQPPLAGRTGPSRTASSAAIGTNRRLSSSALGLLGSRAHRATLDGEGWAEPASPTGSATSAAAGDVTSGAYSRVAARRNSITDGHGGLGGRSGGGGDDEGAELLPAQAAAPHGGPLRGGADAPRVPRGAPTRNASCIGDTDTSMAMPPGSGATADAPRPAARRRGSIDEPLLMQQLGGGVGVSIMGGRRRSMEEVPQTSMSRFVPSVFTAEAALAAAAAAAAAASPNSHGQLSSGLLPAIAPRGGAMSSGSQQRLPSIVSAPASADGVCIGSHGSVEGSGSISSQARLQAHRSSRHQLHHFSGQCKLATPEPTALLPGHYNPYAGKSVVAGGGANDAMEGAAARARSECFAHLPTPAAVLLDATSAVAMRAGGGAAAVDGGALAAPRPVTPATGGRRLSASFINAYAGLGGTGGDVSAGSHSTRQRFNPLADVSPADIGAISSSNGGGAARAATCGSGGRRFSGEFQRPHAPPPTYSHGSLATHQSGMHGTHNAGDAAAAASAAAAGGAGSGGDGGEAGAAGAEGMMQKLRGAFSGLLHKGNSKGYGQSRP